MLATTSVGHRHFEGEAGGRRPRVRGRTFPDVAAERLRRPSTDTSTVIRLAAEPPPGGAIRPPIVHRSDLRSQVA